MGAQASPPAECSVYRPCFIFPQSLTYLSSRIVLFNKYCVFRCIPQARTPALPCPALLACGMQRIPSMFHILARHCNFHFLLCECGRATRAPRVFGACRNSSRTIQRSCSSLHSAGEDACAPMSRAPRLRNATHTVYVSYFRKAGHISLSALYSLTNIVSSAAFRRRGRLRSHVPRSSPAECSVYRPCFIFPQSLIYLSSRIVLFNKYCVLRCIPQARTPALPCPALRLRNATYSVYVSYFRKS